MSAGAGGAPPRSGERTARTAGPGGAPGAAARDPLRVTLVKSVHGQLANIAASVRGLGLRRPRQTVTVADTPENRGMIQTALHLLKVESGQAR